MLDRIGIRPRPALCFVISLVLVVLMASPAAAQQRKPRRPSNPADEPQVQAQTENARAAIKAWWDGARRPRLCVIVGQEQGGKIVYGDSTLTGPLRRELISEITSAGVTVKDPGIDRALKERGLRTLERAEGGRLDAEALDLLRDLYPAEVMVDFVFLQATGGFSGGMDIYNTKTGDFITSKQFGQKIQGEMDAVVAGNWARAFMTLLSEVPLDGAGSSNMRAVLAGIEDAGRADDIASVLEDRYRDHVWRADVETKALDDDSVAATFDVEYEGRARDFRRDLEDVLESMGLTLTGVSTDGNVLSGQVSKNETPDWWVRTDTESEGFDKARRDRVREAQNRSLDVGIFVGDAATASLSAAKNEFGGDGAAPIGFDNETLLNELSNLSSDLGFDVINSEATAERIRQMKADLDDRAPIDNVRDQLWKSAGFDWLLIVKVQRATDDINVAMIDTHSRSTIATARFPDDASPLRGKFKVDPSDPGEVARFLMGRLAPRFDRYLQDREQVISVQIRGMRSVEQVRAMYTAYKDGLRNALRVDSLNGEIGKVMTFEVHFDGSRAALVDEILAITSTRDWGFPVTPNSVGDDTVTLYVDLDAAEDPARITPEAIEQAAKSTDLVSLADLPGTGLSAANGASRWAVVVGVNDYQGGINDLEECVADAKAMAKTLVDECGFPRSHVETLTTRHGDTPPTAKNVLQALGHVVDQAKPGDMVLFHFSGHGGQIDERGGLVDDGSGSSVLFTSDAALEGSRVTGGAIPIARVREAVRDAGDFQFVMLLDACHSGGQKGLAGDDPGLGFIRALEKSATSGNDTHVTLAGCQADEVSYEGNRWGIDNGLFSYFLCRGIRGEADIAAGNGDGRLDFDELYKYVYTNVSYLTSKMKIQQNPYRLTAGSGIPVIAEYKHAND